MTVVNYLKRVLQSKLQDIIFRRQNYSKVYAAIYPPVIETDDSSEPNTLVNEDSMILSNGATIHFSSPIEILDIGMKYELEVRFNQGIYPLSFHINSVCVESVW